MIWWNGFGRLLIFPSAQTSLHVSINPISLWTWRTAMDVSRGAPWRYKAFYRSDPRRLWRHLVLWPFWELAPCCLQISVNELMFGCTFTFNLCAHLRVPELLISLIFVSRVNSLCFVILCLLLWSYDFLCMESEETVFTDGSWMCAAAVLLIHLSSWKA